jgi:hypothetical protein
LVWPPEDGAVAQLWGDPQANPSGTPYRVACPTRKIEKCLPDQQIPGGVRHRQLTIVSIPGSRREKRPWEKSKIALLKRPLGLSASEMWHNE